MSHPLDFNFGMKLISCLIFAGSLLATTSMSRSDDQIEIKPSVWGQNKWYGGYEVYRNGKLDAEIRPSVWGAQKWPGGYEVYKNGKLIGDAKASVWGQDKWYGGYSVQLDEGGVLKKYLNK